jgi:hypothetical protein
MGSSTSETAYDMVVQPDGKIVLAGNRTGSPAPFSIARLRLRGNFFQKLGYELDPTFHSDGRSSVVVMAGENTARAVMLYENRMIIAGHSHNYHDYDFSVAVVENDVYAPPDPEPDPDPESENLYLPSILR